jgi:hypothetical protein
MIQTKNNLIIFVFSYKPEPWEEIYTAHPIGKWSDPIHLLFYVTVPIFEV